MVRPRTLMEDGRPAWLYAPSTARYKGREYTDNLVFKILTDEEMKSTNRKQPKSLGDAERKGGR